MFIIRIMYPNADPILVPGESGMYSKCARGGIVPLIAQLNYSLRCQQERLRKIFKNSISWSTLSKSRVWSEALNFEDILLVSIYYIFCCLNAHTDSMLNAKYIDDTHLHSVVCLTLSCQCKNMWFPAETMWVNKYCTNRTGRLHISASVMKMRRLKNEITF